MSGGESRLTERLGSALRVVADRTDFVPPPFDAHRSPMVVLPEEAEAGHHRRRRALAAAVVLVVLAVGVAALRAMPQERPEDDDVVVKTGEEKGPSVLVPMWMPAGMQLWTAHSGFSDIIPGGGVGGRYQLLGDPNQGTAMLIWVQPVETSGTSGGRKVWVRGERGTLWDLGGGEAAMKKVVWTEGDATLEVRYRGMTTNDAIAVLDDLAWRSDEHQEGFVPPADGPMHQAGEAITVARRQVQFAELGYGLAPSGPAPAAGEEPTGIVVRTVAPTGHLDGVYLEAWFSGSIGADKVVRNQYSPTDRSWHWPDGKQVWVSVVGKPIDDMTFHRIVESVGTVKGKALRELASGAEQAAASSPLVASARFPMATVEVRGDDRMRVVCLRLDGDPAPPARCDTQPIATAMGPEDVETGGFVVDGRWFVVAARLEAAAPTITPAHTTSLQITPAVVSSNGWQVALAEVPDDVDEVEVSWDAKVSLTRPDKDGHLRL
jgi:hypothetical protein